MAASRSSFALPAQAMDQRQTAIDCLYNLNAISSEHPVKVESLQVVRLAVIPRETQ
jgi:hypothetical protein